MFYPILLSMIAATAGVVAQEPEPTIRVTLNNDGQYLPGDRSKVQVITRDDGYLLVFQVNPEGRLRVLFPLDPTDDNYVKGGKRYLLLGRGGREGFGVETAGTGVVFAAVSVDPWRTDGYVVFGHWDYAVFNGINFDDTEPQLVNLAQGMAGGRFDYDIVGYTVASQVAAAAGTCVRIESCVRVGQCRRGRQLLRLWVAGWRHLRDRLLQHVGPVRPVLLLAVLQLRPVLPGLELWSVLRRVLWLPDVELGLGLLRLLQRQPVQPVQPVLLSPVPLLSGLPLLRVQLGGGLRRRFALPDEIGGSHLERLVSAVSSPVRQRIHGDELSVGCPPGNRRAAACHLPQPQLLGRQCIRGRLNREPGRRPGVEGEQRRQHHRSSPRCGPGSDPVASGGRQHPGHDAAEGGAVASSGAVAVAVIAAVGDIDADGVGREGVPSRGSCARTSARAPRAVAAPMPSTGKSSFERRTPTPTALRASRPECRRCRVRRLRQSRSPAATKATVEGRSSEPVLRRREPDKPAASEAPARAPRPESQRDPSLGRSYGNEPSQPSGGAVSAPTGGWNGGGNAGGGGGRATSTPPSGNAGGGGGRASSPPAPSGAVAGGGRRH